MRFRMLPTLALASALGSVAFMAGRADAQQSPGPRFDQRQGPRANQSQRLSPEDRAAFLDARIAAVKAGLKLTPEQEALWPATEQAVRDGLGKMRDLTEQARSQARPDDPIQGMRRMADAAAARADAMHKIADAAQPLYASLNDDQKRRLAVLIHPPGRDGRQMRGPRYGGGQDQPGGLRSGGPRQREGFMDPRDGAGRGQDDDGARGQRGPGRSGMLGGWRL